MKTFKNSNPDESIDDLDDEISAKEEEIKLAKHVAQSLMDIENAANIKKLDKLLMEIEVLKNKKIRAVSQAQITRAGYIYVISNIGSFGEGVVKIGMTRRLEPMDRVMELGDASVPYRFDVHALVFVEDAPFLEKHLHRVFTEFRVNTENHRKEFFRITAKQVKEEMENQGIETEWYFEIEAKEFRESVLIRNLKEKQKKEKEGVLESLPKTI